MYIPNFIKATLLILFFSFSLYAQNTGSIKGTVSHSDTVKLKAISVKLLDAEGKKIIKAVLTDMQGNFEFLALANNTYYITINTVNYEQYLSPPIVIDQKNLSIILAKINLKSAVNNLNEVKITAKVPFVVQKADKTIVNPDALIANAGSNALEVLAKSPGVIVGENGEVKLRGKSGVSIFIDDKPTYLTGSELENYLKSLPSDAIKQIELMTNPPAKYEASGNAGIINIVTKRNKLKGLNGNLGLNYGQGKYGKNLNNLNLNYNTSKIALFSNLSYTNTEGYHDLTIKRQFKNPDLSPKSAFEQNTYLKSNLEAYSLKLGMDYYLSDKNTIGITTKGLLNITDRNRFNKALETDANKALTQTVIADNNEKMNFKNGAVTLNFRHQFDKPNQLLTVDLDFVSYSSTIDQLYKNNNFSPSNVNTYSDVQNGNLPSKIKIYAFKSDYTLPFDEQTKLDLGIKTSCTKTDNNAVYTITKNNITQNNYSLSNHFFYDEWINAAYANYSKSFKKIDVQAGLRFEDTQLNGNQLGNPLKPSSNFKNNYNGFFPTVYISYKLDSMGTKTINLSYGKRVERPFYKDLNPFSSPLDQFTFYEGNPYLKPTFAHNFSLSHTYKELLTSTFSYTHTKDDISETIEINNGIYYSRPNNIGKSDQYTFSLQSRFSPTKWLNTVVYSEINYSHYKSKLYTQDLDAKGTYWFINSSNSIKFSDQWSAEISGQYITKSLSTQFTIGDYGYVSIGAQKKILKDMGTLKFNLSDVFFTNQIRGTINNLELTDANWYGPRDTRVASLSFSYRFGTSNNKKAKYNNSGSESEQNRVKM